MLAPNAIVGKQVAAMVPPSTELKISTNFGDLQPFAASSIELVTDSHY